MSEHVGLRFQELERVPADCCTDHHVMCWYDACCGKCPELERCRCHWGHLRCSLPVSQHKDKLSIKPEDHEWFDPRPPTQVWEGDSA